MANLFCTYDITNTSKPTKILQDPSGISDIIFNGESIGVVSEYQFHYWEEYTLEFVLKDATVIPKLTFTQCGNLISVVIPETVIEIGTSAFRGCSRLKEIVIPNSVTSIGHSAFADCIGLTSITIPDSVTSIGDDAFYRCDNLTSVTLGLGVTSIGAYAFNSCSNLTEIIIPDSVKTIGNNAFANCYDLTSITIPDSVKTISNYTFYTCIGLTSVTIGSGVTSIGTSAFRGCSSLTTITIPASTTYIYSYAFYECSSLTSITIPESVIYIGTSAFADCYNLNRINSLNKYAPVVYSSTFGVAEGGTLYYPKSSDYSSWLSGDEYYLGYFGWNGATFGTADSSIKPVVHKITCTYNVTNTGEPTAICYKTKYFSDITYNGTSIGVTKNYTFNTTGKHTLEFILSNPYIETYGFYKCDALTSVKIGEGVKGIEKKAFEECKSLKSIEIPLTTVFIGDYAFYGCSELSTIISYAIEPDNNIGMDAFQYVQTGGTLYYPKGVDYSSWLKSSLYYLGYYGWNGVEFDIDNPPELPDEPDVPTYPDGEIVTPNKTMIIVTSGKTFQYPIETNNIDYLHNYYIYFNGNKYLDTIDGFISIEMVDMNNFNITVEENEGDERHCSIYFEYRDYNGNLLTHKLAITQDAKYVEPDEPDVPDSPSIDLEYNNITAPQGGITSTLDIETNGVEVIEIIAPEWVEVIDKGGYYEIEVLPNEGIDREGEVIFIGNPNKPNKVQQNIIITQKGNEEMATSIGFNKLRLDFAATGGTGYVEVKYINAQTVNTPTCQHTWVTIEEDQIGNTTTDGQPTKQIRYKITMQPSSFARQTNITFSCVGTNGNTVSQNKFMVYQAAPALALPTITLEKSSIEFDSTGYAENFSVTVTYADTDTVLEPVVNGDWITVTEGLPVQGGSSGSGTAIVKRYLIEVTATDAYRQGTVVFKASNDNGTTNSPIFSVIQLAPVEEEEIVPVVSAYTKTATVKYDGSSTGIAITSLGCSYKNVANVLTPVVNGDWIHLGEGILQSSLLEDTYVYRYPITFDTNDSVERIGYVTFKGTDEEGKEYSDITKITQQAVPITPDEPEPELPEDSKEVTYSPIWKDVEYTFVDDTEYGIYYDRIHYFQGQMFVDEILLFKGKAYLPPDNSVVKVSINKICQNYMNENPNIFDGAVGYSHSYNEFKLKNSYGTLLHTYRFVNDWSYKELTLGIKTNPIIPHIADGQKLFFSAFATEQKSIKWGMRYYDGTADYNNTEYVADDFTTVMVVASRQKYVNTFYFGDKSFTVLPKCECKYVLYYMNPYGGYDWLPITGKVVRKDKVETFVYTKNYNNTTADFGKNRYMSNITVSYNLNTGWLTQEQSDRMWELLESNTVWLHNLDEDRIYPVMITDTNIEHKQKFGKKKRLSYSINVELSQTRERV